MGKFVSPRNSKVYARWVELLEAALDTPNPSERLIKAVNALRRSNKPYPFPCSPERRRELATKAGAVGLAVLDAKYTQEERTAIGRRNGIKAAEKRWGPRENWKSDRWKGIA